MWELTAITRRMERWHGCIVDGDMVRVVIAADGIESENHLWAQPPNPVDNLFGDLLKRRRDQRIRMPVILTAGHSRVPIIEKDYRRQPQRLGRATQFLFAQCGDVLMILEEFRINCARLPTTFPD